MSVCGTQISYLGAMAVGAMIDGQGFRPYLGHVDTMNATANGLFGKVEAARQAANTRGVSNANSIRDIGERDILGNGAFTGTVTDAYKSTVGSGSVLTQYKAHINLMFGSNPLQMAQTIGIVGSLTNTSAQLAPTLEKLNAGIDFGRMPGLDKLEYPADGVFPTYLGSGYPDYLAVQTNGTSTLFNNPTSENYTKLANDLARLGNTFDLNNIENFGNPGQIIQRLTELNGIGISGLTAVLDSINLDPNLIFDLGSANYNELMLQVLQSVTTPTYITNAQDIMTSAIENMTSLASYVDFDIIFVESKDVVSFKTIDEFRTKLQAIELGRISTPQELANYLVSINIRSLPTIKNRTNFVERDYIQPAINKFLGGTGANGRITLVDMVGLLGGIGIQDQVSAYDTAMKALNTAGEFTTLSALFNELTAGLNGDYTTITVVSPEEVLINPPRGPNHTGLTADAYDSFSAYYVGLIEAELQRLMSRRNVEPNFDIAINNYKLIVKKIYDEKEFQSRIDMNYGFRTNYPDTAYTFITSATNDINDPGRKEVMLGMNEQAVQEGDVAAEFIRAFINEGENKSIGSVYDVRWRSEVCE
jgi:hypothetical protein